MRVDSNSEERISRKRNEQGRYCPNIEGKYAENTTRCKDSSPRASPAKHSSTSKQISGISSTTEGRGSLQNFPAILYDMLERAENDLFGHIISWRSHGRSFQVHNKELLVKEVLPRYCGIKQFASFQRQLNLYDFRRTTKRGPEYGSYYHKLFIRGKPTTVSKIQRCKAVPSGIAVADRKLQGHKGEQEKVREKAPSSSSHTAAETSRKPAERAKDRLENNRTSKYQGRSMSPRLTSEKNASSSNSIISRFPGSPLSIPSKALHPANFASFSNYTGKHSLDHAMFQGKGENSDSSGSMARFLQGVDLESNSSASSKRGTLKSHRKREDIRSRSSSSSSSRT